MPREEHMFDVLDKLLSASQTGDVEELQCLLKSFKPCAEDMDLIRDYIGRTALHMACDHGHLDVAEILLENGSDRHSATQDGDTPLHLACLHGHLDIVEFLLRTKVDINLTNILGETTLHGALYLDDPEIVALLLAENLDKTVLCRGRSYLDYACDLSSVESVELLLDAGFSVNGEPTSPMTPLHYAAREGNIEIVELLFRRGADVNILTKYDGKYVLPVQMSRKKSVRMCFRKHFMKLKTANFFLSKRNLKYLRSPNEELLEFEIYCNAELQSMKYRREIVPGVSWYDILCVCDDNRSTYASDATLIELLKSYDLEAEFPLYVFAFDQCIQDIYEKYILMAGEDAISRISSFALPYVVTREIRGYLSREDLLSLINVIKIIEE